MFFGNLSLEMLLSTLHIGTQFCSGVEVRKVVEN